MLRKHIYKLIFRAALFLLAVFFHIDFTNPFVYPLSAVFLGIIWLILVVEMTERIIPNKKVTMGARKHFATSFATAKPLQSITKLHQGAFLSSFSWFIITSAIIFTLHIVGQLSPQNILILTLFYSLVDLAFIIFFCPFRKLFMKNFCCQSCRIYNWDYMMMCAPLLLFPSLFSLTLVGLAALVLIFWEYNLIKNPQRFKRETNGNLRCDSCVDKLCGLSREKTTKRAS